MCESPLESYSVYASFKKGKCHFEGAKAGHECGAKEKSSTPYMVECPLLQDFSSPPARSPSPVRSK
jgi:hypothetical protein